MATNINKKLGDLIAKVIEDKDVPYIIGQFKELIDETDKEARADERNKVLEECEYRLHEEIMEAFMQAMVNINQVIFRQIHELKNNENEED